MRYNTKQGVREMKKYRILNISRSADSSVKMGDIVYEFQHYDFGLASDESRISKIEHISVTLNPTGDYPFFTIPVIDIEEIKK